MAQADVRVDSVAYPNPNPTLAAALDRGPIVADGGLSTVLDQLGTPASGPLWTGEVLASRPDQVRRAHRAMLDAGAQVILASGYQVSGRTALLSGRSAATADRLLVEANRLVREARDGWAANAETSSAASPAPISATATASVPAASTASVSAWCAGRAWVAASIGPFGAALADGSEYQGEYGLTVAALTAFHRERLDVLAAAQASPPTSVDVWWFETVPDPDEVAALVAGLAPVLAELDVARLPVPEVIVTMTVGRDGRVPTGAPIDEALAPMLRLDPTDPARPVALGVNCCAPQDVAPALDRLAMSTDLPLVAKPNLSGTWDHVAGVFVGAVSDGSSSAGHRPLEAWLDLGARLIGGCCGTGTFQLSRIAAQLANLGPAGGHETR